MLSDDAKAVAGSHFGLMVAHKGEVSFATPSRITPRAKAALDELVAEDILSLEERDGGLIYTPIVDCTHYTNWLASNPHKGNFKIVDVNGPAGVATFSRRQASPLPAQQDQDDGPPAVLADIETLVASGAYDLSQEQKARVLIEFDFLIKNADPADLPTLASVVRLLDYLGASKDTTWSSLGIDDHGNVLIAWMSPKGMMTAKFNYKISWAITLGEGDGRVLQAGSAYPADFPDKATADLLPQLAGSK